MNLLNFLFSLFRCNDQPFTCEHSSILFLFKLGKSPISTLGVDIHQIQGISYQITLNQLIERSVGGKAGGMIDFKQMTLIVSIKHKVESKYLKAHISSNIPWLTGPILMLQVRLSSNHGLDNGLLNISPKLMRLEAHILKRLKKLSQRLLMPIT